MRCDYQAHLAYQRAYQKKRDRANPHRVRDYYRRTRNLWTALRRFAKEHPTEPLEML